MEAMKTHGLANEQTLSLCLQRTIIHILYYYFLCIIYISILMYVYFLPVSCLVTLQKCCLGSVVTVTEFEILDGEAHHRT